MINTSALHSVEFVVSNKPDCCCTAAKTYLSTVMRYFYSVARHRWWLLTLWLCQALSPSPRLRDVITQVLPAVCGLCVCEMFIWRGLFCIIFPSKSVCAGAMLIMITSMCFYHRSLYSSRPLEFQQLTSLCFHAWPLVFLSPVLLSFTGPPVEAFTASPLRPGSPVVLEPGK